MNKTYLAMNICWNHKNHNQYNYYVKFIDWCAKYNIKLIRIIFSKWGLNCVYNKDEVIVLKKILEYATEKKLDIVLTLLNFTDFNMVNYLDINDKNYSWLFNKYRDKYKKNTSFFQTVDNDLVEDINFILKNIKKYKNVKYIEIMNEIDQVNCNDKKLINWCNSLIDILLNKYPNYIYTCSISNYQKYSLYKKKMKCYVDLHAYSFPMESAFLNLQYMSRDNALLYVGEYAKNSDYPYMDNYKSKLYFTSGLWGAYFLRLTYTPMSWWWDEIIDNIEYENIIDFYNLNSNFEVTNIEKESINDTKLEYIKDNSNKNMIENKKIIERIKNIMIHPLFLFKEFKNIKKYLTKKTLKESNVHLYRINSNFKKKYYIECDVHVKLDLFSIIQKQNICIYDLINCTKRDIKLKKNKKIELFGCYIFEEK